jgi:hypothetical protein
MYQWIFIRLFKNVHGLFNRDSSASSPVNAILGGVVNDEA